MNEVTLAIIKPDAVKMNVVGEILHLVEKRTELRPIAMQMATLDDNCWAAFYEEHVGKPFFQELCSFMASGPCVFVAFEGDNAVEVWREMMGATDPRVALPETMRQLFGTGAPANAVHGSASPEEAKRELELIEQMLPRRLTV